MADKRLIELGFPLGGLDRNGAYRQQAPYTTQDCANSRPRDTLAGRMRGGSRPGLFNPFTTASLTDPIRMAATVEHTMNTAGSFVSGDIAVWTDTFEGSALSSIWTAASWLSGSPSVSDDMAYYGTASSSVGVVRSAIGSDFRPASAYEIQLLIVPYEGVHSATYSIFFRMSDATPVATTNGAVVSVTLSSGGAYSGTLTNYASSTPTAQALTSGTLSADKPVWLNVRVLTNAITVTLGGATLISSHTIGAAAGERFGFGISGVTAGTRGQVDRFRIQYDRDSEPNDIRPNLIVSAGGNVYRETTLGRLAISTQTLTLASDRQLMAVEYLNKLYIADYSDMITGTDGTLNASVLTATGHSNWATDGVNQYDFLVEIYDSNNEDLIGTWTITTVSGGNLTISAPSAASATASYRICRGPKSFDPLTNALALLNVGVNDDSEPLGTMPLGCPIIFTFNSRLGFAAPPHAPGAWFLSRQENPADFDYGADDRDPQRALAGGTSQVSVGQPIKAAIPIDDDTLLFGCRDTLWVLDGDPAMGGTLRKISDRTGIVDRFAWTRTAEGVPVFAGISGIFVMSGGNPEPISENKLPRELRDLDALTSHVQLAYDSRDRGVHIMLTPLTTGTTVTHYWLDWETKGYWPVTYSTSFEPLVLCDYKALDPEDNCVLIGMRSGKLLRHFDLAEKDDGTAFTSYVDLGPIDLGGSNGHSRGIFNDFVADMAVNSGPVTWGVYVADTPEQLKTASAFSTGTLSLPRSYRVYAKAGGGAMKMRLSSSGRRWAIETINAVLIKHGRLRVT